jgi:EAL domain-containing protein (putative c-di-GMP-specific phosphodiesterase class I)/ActR/RegA family two-component response regulator
MKNHQIVLLLDDDLMITEGLAAGLARGTRTVLTCNDVESAKLVVAWIRPSHVVSDVRLTGAFGYEGLDFIRDVKRMSPDTRVILMTGDAPDALQLEASERGAVGFLQKPFEVDALNSMLDLMAPVRSGSEDWPDIIRIPTLDVILESNSLSTAFQPIVKLSNGEQLGYEALLRNGSDSLFRNPETLFQYATSLHRVGDLEMACIRHSLHAAVDLPSGSPIFMNVHPTVFSSARLHDTIVEESGRAGIALNRIVLEITEQGSLSGDRAVIDSIKKIKALGCRFAFDDVGVAYSHLPFIEVVRPSFLKISQQFGTAFEGDATKTKIVRNILALSNDFDAELILEGIEGAATADAAAALGIKYGQGFYFARPAAASSFSRHPLTIPA